MRKVPCRKRGGIQPIESLLNTHTIVCDYPHYTDYPNIVAMREKCSERTSSQGGGSSVVRIMLVPYIIYNKFGYSGYSGYSQSLVMDIRLVFMEGDYPVTGSR